MDNWLVTALTAAATALGALMAGGGPAPHHVAVVPHALGPAAPVAAPLRPGPAPGEKDERPRADAVERPSRAQQPRVQGHRTSKRHHHRAHSTRGHHRQAKRRHHGHGHRHSHGHRHGHRHAAHHAKAPRRHGHHRAHRATHRHRRATRHAAARSLVVRRSPLAASPVLRHGVPLRRIIGIRHALGMRPAMGALGTDVSWPQCGGSLPMPLDAARFVVVGLTDGPAFSANHCLRAQVAWIRAHHRHVASYAVVSYPDRRELRRLGHRGPYRSRTLAGRLRNVGYQQARLNLRRMHGAGLHSPLLWIDLEPSSTHPWARRHGLNAAVVRGLVHGYRRAGQPIGFYSTASIWREIVGGLRFGAPEWRTAGPASPRAALGRCRERDAVIQGGRAVLAQWWNDRRDHDLLCPGSRGAGAMARWFEKS